MEYTHCLHMYLYAYVCSVEYTYYYVYRYYYYTMSMYMYTITTDMYGMHTTVHGYGVVAVMYLLHWISIL